MKRRLAVTLAAGLLLGNLEPAACAPAQAAGPFESIPLAPSLSHGHGWAYASLAGGAGLIGLSFALTGHANRTYDRYLAATDPPEVERLYDETVRYDRLSSASLLTGEALIATGIWLRFLRRPAASRVHLSLSPRRCSVALSF
ncbi:MAG: hypothetical protein HZC42_03485 [Candidatus Eisenbacteria bacterium]|nr:hypothetical protein [Candidatus Eisenbacteria bacterium]